jgi:glutamate/tyrosine decarboxylase-like PLP-dependent enzyme
VRGGTDSVFLASLAARRYLNERNPELSVEPGFLGRDDKMLCPNDVRPNESVGD